MKCALDPDNRRAWKKPLNQALQAKPCPTASDTRATELFNLDGLDPKKKESLAKPLARLSNPTS